MASSGKGNRDAQDSTRGVSADDFRVTANYSLYGAHGIRARANLGIFAVLRKNDWLLRPYLGGHRLGTWKSGGHLQSKAFCPNTRAESHRAQIAIVGCESSRMKSSGAVVEVKQYDGAGGNRTP